MLNINLKDWHPRDNIPITKELKKQQRMNIPRADKTIKDFIECGEFPGEFTVYGDYQIRSGELYDYLDKSFPDGKKATMNAKWESLRRLGIEKKRTPKGMLLSFPTLSITRERWNKHYPAEEWDLTEDWIVRKSEY